MWHLGIDLHRKTLVMAGVHDSGQVTQAVRIACDDTQAILAAVEDLRPFRAVIEATGTYRWLYRLLAPHGTVLLAHPLRLRAMIQRRGKTDKLDALLLANLLRINQIPLAYVPPEAYQQLRDLTRCRADLVQGQARAKIQLRALLARHNGVSPWQTMFGMRGRRWLAEQDFGPIDNLVRDELLQRLTYFEAQVETIDRHLLDLSRQFPQVEAILDIHGIGLYTALVIVAELGEVERFRRAKQVSAYVGLTARVRQSGDHCYHGSITREGSPRLRWLLVEAAIKVVRKDAALHNFYTRIRKRSGVKIARVAVARKLAEICWKRLRRWEREHPAQAA